ncbi:MAG: GNAT family N-acetyltransferase [Candidatus Hodarchaeota archaeon]
MPAAEKEIITRTFRNDDEIQVNSVIKRSFNNPGANAYPFPPKRFIVVAELEGKIIGHTSIRPILVHLKGNVVRAGILHMVATDPDYQKKGAGHLMMDKAVEIMEKEKLAISLLKTSVPSFYEKKGWHVIVDRDETITIPKEKFEAIIREDSEDVQVLDGDLRNIDNFIELRNEYAKNFNCFSHANKKFFTKVYNEYASGAITNFFHEIKVNDVLTGYFFGKRMSEVKQGEKLSHVIHELVLNTWSRTIIYKIIEFLFSFDDEFECVNIHCPVDENVLPFLEEIGTKIQSQMNLVDMLRVNLPEKLEFASIGEDEVIKWLKSTDFKQNLFVDYYTEYFQSYLADMKIFQE